MDLRRSTISNPSSSWLDNSATAAAKPQARSRLPSPERTRSRIAPLLQKAVACATPPNRPPITSPPRTTSCKGSNSLMFLPRGFDVPKKLQAAPLEDQHLVGFGGRHSEFIHRAATGTGQKCRIIKTTRIHAGATQQHLAIASHHTLKHSFGVVITIRCLLASLSRNNRVGHQKDGYLSLGLLLQQRVSESESVVDPLGAVR